MMPRILYLMDGSAPCRAAWMALKAAGVDFEVKRVDLINGEQKEDWFVKMNPKHTAPTLDDNGFYLWESRAIMRYVCNAYAPDSDLYPSDPKQRALVDRALDADIGSVYKEVLVHVYPGLFRGQPFGDSTNLCQQLKDIDTFTPLAQGKFLVGDHMTIADISTVTSVTFLETVDFDLSSYPNVVAWIKKMKAQPFFEECNAGFQEFKELIKSGFFKK